MSNWKLAACVAAALAVGGYVAGAPARAESVMKECGDEWKAAKAANTTGGKTWQQFLGECKTRHGAAAPAATPAAAPAPSPTPTPTPTKAAAPAPAPKAAAAPTGAGQFASEGEAKNKCPSDAIVWVNNESHVYHVSGDRYYGKTKKGAYMCQADANAAGDHESKAKIKTK